MALLYSYDLATSLFKQITLSEVLLYGGTALAAYHVVKAIYNISPLHPLSHIPGPKFAAATYFPEFWDDVIRGGRYTKTIRDMHAKYGSIVRINPDEIHCSDAAFADEIFPAGGKRRDKPQHQVRALGAWSANIFGCADHETHRLRRAAVARFFSRSMIAQLEGDIRGLVGRLCDKLLAERGRGRPIDVTMAYSCLASDIISDYCFGEPFGLLAQETWEPNFRQAGMTVVRPGYWFRFFPFLSPLVGLGTLFVDYLPEDMALFVRTLLIDIPARIARTKAEMDAGTLSSRDRPTVFVELIGSDLPAHEKTADRLKAEAFSLLGAATETTSWGLGVMTYHLLSQPETMAKLRAEVQDAVEDPLRLPPLSTLEKLPYLGAVIQEGLRLSYGVSARTARIAPEDLVYRGEFRKKPVELVLPRGYPIGMSTVITHHDEAIFPDSHAFVPERWLEEGGTRRRRDMDRAFLAFGRGSRVCLGMSLAQCELYLTLAALTLRVFPHMRLFETTERDVRYDHDTLSPNPARESRGIRVTVEEVGR